MSTLSPRAQLLFEVGKKSLPRVVVDALDENLNESLAGHAKQFELVWDEVEKNINDTYLLNAQSSGDSGTLALDVHARDRGTRRQSGETNPPLAYRLRFLLEDSVTAPGLITKASAIMSAFGAPVVTGYPALVELRRDVARFGFYAGKIACVPVASLVDGETFTVNDDTHATRTFEIDKAGDGVTGGRTQVNVSTDTTADEVAARVATAIAGEATISCDAEVSDREAATVYVTKTGAPSRIVLTESVANSGFTVQSGRRRSYFSRGYRMTGASRAATVIIMILPFGTSAACATAVSEALRPSKAGGVKVLVERRLT